MSYCPEIYGQRPAIIHQAIEAAGAEGITPEALAAVAHTTVRALVVVLSRLRKNAGLMTVSVRSSQRGEARYYLAAHDPRIKGVKVAPVAATAARAWAKVVQHAGPEGVDCQVMAGDASRWLKELAFRAMRHQGWAHFSSYSEKHGRRAFAKAEWAEAYRERLYGRPVLKTAPRKSEAVVASLIAEKIKASKTAPARAAPAKMPRAAQTWQPPQPKALPPAIVPANVKRVVAKAPAFDARYQIDPRTRVLGGFATLGPGRYLDDEQAQAANEEREAA